MYEFIKDALLWMQGRSDRHSEKVDAGLRSLMAAILATKKYEEFHAETDRDREKEYLLADLWAKAAADMRVANNDLALRLGDKSRYWSEPVQWNEEVRAAKRIKLMSLEDEVRQLLETS